ncbi:hypothetical protein Q1695_001784 [Nippostrongylus brasiliensis]|nr:hypothetical protein Q1695_001784 [Nippostrongylus brasiliensis]
MGDVNVSSGYNKVIGALLTGLWFATLAFTLFLTINRLITVLLHIWFPVLASPVVTYVLFTLSYLSLVVPFILKLLPDCNYVFDSSTFSWSDLPTDGYLSTVMRRTGKYLIIVTVILSIVTYLLIFCYIACFSAGRLSRREFLITVQVSMLALYFLFSFVYWNYLMDVFGESTLSYFFSCIVWVVMNGIHPLIYLVFNTRLRRSFVHLFTHRRMPREISSVTVIAMKRAKM